MDITTLEYVTNIRQARYENEGSRRQRRQKWAKEFDTLYAYYHQKTPVTTFLERIAYPLIRQLQSINLNTI